MNGLATQRPTQTLTLSPLVRRILADNPSAFTFWGTETYVVGNAAGVAVIDPGPDIQSHLDALMAAIDGAPVHAIMCTHTHRDHSPASRPLSAMTGAPIIGCAPLALDDGGPRADAAFDADYLPDRVLVEDDVVSGEGWTLRAVATPGHTSNHLCYALEQENALFTGDHVMGWSTTVVSPPDGDMADYMASLDKLMRRSDKVYYPAHGDPVEQPQRFVRGLAGHRKHREGQILRLLREEPRTIPLLVAKMYVGVDPGLHPAAGRSVLAHLLDLESRGQVVCDKEIWRCA